MTVSSSAVTIMNRQRYDVHHKSNSEDRKQDLPQGSSKSNANRKEHTHIHVQMYIHMYTYIGADLRHRERKLAFEKKFALCI